MKILSRNEAQENNLVRYYTGVPCKHGHISERYTKSRICCECKNADNREKKYKYNRPDNYYENYALRRKELNSFYRKLDYVIIRNKINRQKYKSRVKGELDELTELVLEEANKLISLRNEETKIQWELDHMIPLHAKSVSGLHVYNNLQVIPKAFNRSKGNKLIFTNRYEWIRTG